MNTSLPQPYLTLLPRRNFQVFWHIPKFFSDSPVVIPAGRGVRKMDLNIRRRWMVDEVERRSTISDSKRFVTPRESPRASTYTKAPQSPRPPQDVKKSHDYMKRGFMKVSMLV